MALPEGTIESEEFNRGLLLVWVNNSGLRRRILRFSKELLISSQLSCVSVLDRTISRAIALPGDSESQMQ
jgi:hypothetical protein